MTIDEAKAIPPPVFTAIETRLTPRVTVRTLTGGKVLRAPSDTVQLKVRMKERLRADIERAARKGGYSLNAEIVRRIEASFDAESNGTQDDARETEVMTDGASNIPELV